jgi:hypothetical protein
MGRKWTPEQKAALSAKLRGASTPDPAKNQAVVSEGMSRRKKLYHDTADTHYLHVGHIPEDWGLGNPVDDHIDDGYAVVEARRTETVMSIPMSEYKRRTKESQDRANKAFKDQTADRGLEGRDSVGAPIDQTTNVLREHTELVSAKQALGE